MDIKLKKLILNNFKGIKEKEIEFTDKTNISGDRGKKGNCNRLASLLILKAQECKYSLPMQTTGKIGIDETSLKRIKLRSKVSN